MRVQFVDSLLTFAPINVFESLFYKNNFLLTNFYVLCTMFIKLCFYKKVFILRCSHDYKFISVSW